MSLSGWNFWDIFIIVLGIYFIVRGSLRGLVGEVVTLAGFLASFYLSFHWSGAVGETLAKTMGLNAYVAQVLAALLIWLAVTMIAAVVRMLLKGILGAARLGGIDKLLGLFTGMLKTVVVVLVKNTGGLLQAPVTKTTWKSESTILT